MFKILVLFAALYILLIPAFYWLLTWISKRDGDDARWYLRLFGAFFFSLIVAVVIMLLVFVFFGSVTIAQSVLGFEIDGGMLFYIIVVVIAYAFLFDNMIALIAAYLFRTSLFIVTAMAIIRFIIFYMIGIFFELSQQTNTMLAIVLIGLFLIMDILEFREKKKES
ncbi:hypothetical protein [Oceanobacillus locisalsi]|uniref:Uncharacterized protein n=1 Tax=Oceanobacillus locisalsi TaxID=546107 RepID=A0ABW3NL65_9BACI